MTNKGPTLDDRHFAHCYKLYSARTNNVSRHLVVTTQYWVHTRHVHLTAPQQFQRKSHGVKTNTVKKVNAGILDQSLGSLSCTRLNVGCIPIFLQWRIHPSKPSKGPQTWRHEFHTYFDVERSSYCCACIILFLTSGYTFKLALHCCCLCISCLLAWILKHKIQKIAEPADIVARACWINSQVCQVKICYLLKICRMVNKI